MPEMLKSYNVSWIFQFPQKKKTDKKFLSQIIKDISQKALYLTIFSTQLETAHQRDVRRMTTRQRGRILLIFDS